MAAPHSVSAAELLELMEHRRHTLHAHLVERLNGVPYQHEKRTFQGFDIKGELIASGHPQALRVAADLIEVDDIIDALKRLLASSGSDVTVGLEVTRTTGVALGMEGE